MDLLMDDGLFNGGLVISILDESRKNAHFNCVSIDKNTLHETSVRVLVDSGKYLPRTIDK